MTLKTALFYERYELKYHIPLAMVDEISAYIEPFCELDHFSKISPDKYYAINNLYLDTPDYLFFRRSIEGIEGRFNMRIRNYGDEINPLYFLEIKKKNGGFVKKTRAKIYDLKWFEDLSHFTMPNTQNEFVKNDFAYDFAYNVLSYGAAPVVFTQYRRKAYFSHIDDYARVTFDKDMRFIPRDHYGFERSKDMKYYDYPEYFEPETHVVLELKCEARVPFWIIDLIRHFNLERSGFSKFLFAVNELNAEKVQIAQYPHRLSAHDSL
jgi:SPX domain protein involved in polyphosphate accumulation